MLETSDRAKTVVGWSPVRCGRISRARVMDDLKDIMTVTRWLRMSMNLGS